MKNSVFLILSTGFYLFACTDLEQNDDQDRILISKQLIEIEQLKEPDMVWYLGFFTDDVIIMPPDRPAIQGKEDALEFYETAFSGVSSLDIDYSEPIIELSGDLATRIYTGMAIIRFSDGDQELVVNNKYLDVLRKSDDGSWKIKIHSWGTND